MARNQPAGVRICIGGLVVELEGLRSPLAARVRRRYAKFLVEGTPDLRLTLRAGRDGEFRPTGMPDVTRAGQRSFAITYGSLVAGLDLAAGTGEADLPPSIWVVDSLLRMTIGLMLAERGGLLVHGSGVRVPDGALVCFGPSGVGKTTVARSVAPDDVMCDEMIALIPNGSGVRAFGTPFHGDYSVCAPLSAPLCALVRLVQGPSDSLEPLSPAAAAQALLNSTLFFCRDEDLAETLLSSAIRVCMRQVFRLTFQRGTHVPGYITSSLGLATAGSDPQAAGSRPRG